MYKNTLYTPFKTARLQDIKACFHKIKLKLTIFIPLKNAFLYCVKKTSNF